MPLYTLWISASSGTDVIVLAYRAKIIVNTVDFNQFVPVRLDLDQLNSVEKYSAEKYFRSQKFDSTARSNDCSAKYRMK